MAKLNFWIEQNLDDLFKKKSKSLDVKDAFLLEKEKQKFKSQLLDFSERQMNKAKLRKRSKEIQNSKDAENKDWAVKTSKMSSKLHKQFTAMANTDLQYLSAQYVAKCKADRRQQEADSAARAVAKRVWKSAKQAEEDCATSSGDENIKHYQASFHAKHRKNLSMSYMVTPIRDLGQHGSRMERTVLESKRPSGLLSSRHVNIEEEAAVRPIRAVRSNVRRGGRLAAHEETPAGYQSRTRVV